jgi:hypothetical protein
MTNDPVRFVAESSGSKVRQPRLQCSCEKEEQIGSWAFSLGEAMDLFGRDILWEMLGNKESQEYTQKTAEQRVRMRICFFLDRKNK